MNTTKTRIGTIGVDSGQVLIIDPCYVVDGDKYIEVCETTLNDDGYGEVFGGVASSTLSGDGEYPVYAELNAQGSVVRLIIDFEHGDACDQCGNSSKYCDCGYF